MRRRWLLALLVCTSALAGVRVGLAQDRLPIEFGQWVEGSISSDVVDVRYSFTGTKGQLILVEMIPKPGTYDLDPALVLRDSDGDIIGQNDDFSYPLSIVVAELPSDEDYVVLATRAGGRDGDSVGPYWLRVTPVEPLGPGSKIEVPLTSDEQGRVPHTFVLRPAESGPLKIGFSQPVSGVFARFEFSEWQDDSYPTPLLDVISTAGVTTAAVTVTIERGKIYGLVVAVSDYVYLDEPGETTVTFAFN